MPLRRNPTTTTQLLTDLKHQTDQDDHDDQLANIHTTIGKMQREIETFGGQIQDVAHKTEHVLAKTCHLQDHVSFIEQHLPNASCTLTSSRMHQWVVSHYQFIIGEEIGRGSWATVHKATFRGNTVAAKCLHDVIDSPQTRELFWREMVTAVICQHKNIVTFLGATLDGKPVILMELMDTNLRDAYSQNRISVYQKPQILCNVAQALCYLHGLPNSPVIHRDVSSANVLLRAISNDKWLLKLGDFGTAKIQQQTTTPGPLCCS